MPYPSLEAHHQVQVTVSSCTSCDSPTQCASVDDSVRTSSSSQCKASPTNEQSALTQIVAEHEGQDRKRALHVQDERLAGADASLHSRAQEINAGKWSREEASGPPHSQVDLEKGIGAAEDELLGFELGEASGDYEEERKCRVCHLVFEVEPGSSEAMQLGCHCKNDLSIAHRDCAEAWFKIKGNRICEICGATVQNIVGNEDPGFMDQWNERDADTLAEPQTRCWQSLSLCNFFLACMVLTFILLWLFRVTIS